MLAAILSSTEYYNDAGGTAQGWVTALYRDLLGRAPGGGISFWEHELAVCGPGDRDGIVRDALSSPSRSSVVGAGIWLVALAQLCANESRSGWDCAQRSAIDFIAGKFSGQS